ncbi:MAG TPA: VWA domain-containing protein [Planctomycetota bacterium]|nr:VWA domain-containing protein [Planctomycetota bacterium]
MIVAALEMGWQWRDPAWFWLLAIVPVLVWWRRARAARAAFAAAGLLHGALAAACDDSVLPASWRERAAAVPLLLEVLAIALAVCALARPVQRVPLPPEREGRDVLLCLDRSSSMAAEDLAEGRTRLDVAKEVASRFVAERGVDRTGFVTFARYADLGCPPTLDRDAVRALLGGVQMVDKEGPEDATAIGAAVALAAEVLARSPAKGKVVVLLTDGEENVATSAAPAEIAPLHAGQLCAAFGIRVHAVVVGKGNQKADGRFVPLDTTAVRQLAETTGGRFFAAPDAAALRAVYADIDALEAVAFAEPRVWVREWFALALGLSVLAAAGAHCLARTVLGVLP